MTDLSGLVVVVAGAAGDLGRATTRAAAASGATVVAVGRSAERLAALEGPGVVPSVVDLTDEAATLAWGHELVETYGHVDGLLHLVGGWRGGKGIVETDLADWDWLHENLIRTLQHTSRALHDALVASPRGRLAIVSSTSVAKPTATNAPYAAAKAAAESWTRSVADSFAHSSDDPAAAASVIRIMALVTAQMREANPSKAYRNFTDVDDLAAQLVGLWDRPAAEINGAVW
ncbi:SDR family NAD(P)-dependent oxidoreductase [Branchiibius sp. NY16-3462-2]|uniref:SDR family NAD(P)-dependent oxidoreductase n=1 Tax=Branchiibius sp. NY16-3462-2 TaxID=1807500 RepID=UPI000797741B|nr:SDR family NAD(P)-dependent oxidoreductase [Branchiibius sp. NY16-3462-2]KYH44832.1 hypothetical protein AZH51_01480 [Branchiibius sp. NY16-3462-2]